MGFEITPGKSCGSGPLWKQSLSRQLSAENREEPRKGKNNTNKSSKASNKSLLYDIYAYNIYIYRCFG